MGLVIGISVVLFYIAVGVLIHFLLTPWLIVLHYKLVDGKVSEYTHAENMKTFVYYFDVLYFAMAAVWPVGIPMYAICIAGTAMISEGTKQYNKFFKNSVSNYRQRIYDIVDKDSTQ